MKKLLPGIFLLTVCARIGMAGAPCGILPVPGGWEMIANPCNGGVLPITAFLPVAPEGTTLYKWSGFAYEYDSFIDGFWEVGTMTLSPGEGVFISSPAAAALGFFGVPLLSPQAIALPVGFSIRSAPAGLGLAGFPGAEGDIIFRFNPVISGYDFYEYFEGFWFPEEPLIPPGEAFWVYKTVPALWIQ